MITSKTVSDISHKFARVNECPVEATSMVHTVWNIRIRIMLVIVAIVMKDINKKFKEGTRP